MKIGVVIPAHNEAERIGSVLADLKNTMSGHTVAVFVVDDGSQDATREAARAAGKHLRNLTVLRHQTNLGKGAAAKTGCDAACKHGVEAIVLMDGDGQHNPAEMNRLLAPLKKGVAQLVIGSRQDRASMPLTMRFGNRALTELTRFLFGVSVLDTQSGFRAFTAEAYPKIRWVDPHYAMETEMVIFAATRRIPITEVAIATVYHDNYKGTTVLDGLRILARMVVWRFRLLRLRATEEIIS